MREIEQKPLKQRVKEVSLRRVWTLFREYRSLLFLIIMLALVSAVIGLLPPLVMKVIIDEAIPDGNMKQLVWMVVLMAVLPISSGMLGVWQNYMNFKVAQGVMRDLRQGLFSNLQRQSIGFFTTSRSGEVIQRVTEDVQAVQGVVTNLVVNTITQGVIVITTVVILFAMDWKLALLSVLLLPISMIPVRKVSRLRKQMRQETQKVRAQMSSQLGEVFGISGAMLTRIFGREESQEQQFNRTNKHVMDMELKLNLMGRWFMMFVGVLGPIGTAMIYLYGGYAVIQGTMTIGAIVAFAAYLARLYSPFGTLLNLHVEVVTALGVFQRIFEYMDMEPDMDDKPNAKALHSPHGRVAFHAVDFAYSRGNEAAAESVTTVDQQGRGVAGIQEVELKTTEGVVMKEAGPVLQGITFEALPNEVVALVGPSGAGKSTLISLIARLYDPIAGKITVDDTDLRDIKLQDLRHHIGYVTQESFLFHATIADNLRFAKEDATQEELEDACRKAYIHDFIVSLPQGYDTMVGERGHRLSGGERQRISIARAILKNPTILLLDEATSHLDSESEMYVQAALHTLMQGRTTLVIAHRLSTILAADQILVVQDGRIVEHGRHEELLQQHGMYAMLYETQFEKTGSGV
ncbi:ABC transporter [Paenibacillus selenitireducens]|uniref:ABC transporter n=2 Tax=Paenibacillus selenitireducens TaxID=1324314 RepID=A0A1T2X2Q2_9BACL|nr:ABC transporter ATP-binding protein [Paenibacillus selenitireducens]OPA74171.1 ABC transporter [Paenibacillus selenitireducens]